MGLDGKRVINNFVINKYIIKLEGMAAYSFLLLAPQRAGWWPSATYGAPWAPAGGLWPLAGVAPDSSWTLAAECRELLAVGQFLPF